MRAPEIRSCDRCGAPIVTGQRYVNAGRRNEYATHERLVGCIVSMLVRASRHLGG